MSTKSKSLVFRFRPMLLEDTPHVHALDVLSFAMPWTERSYRFEVTENSHSVLWVVEAAPEEAAPEEAVPAEMVGMLVIWVIMDEAHVATIAVHPDYRSQGIGRQLLAHGLLAAYERGARLSYLEVRRGNQNAQKLYQQFGFEVVGERPHYYQDNQEDALLMTLAELNPEQLRQFAK
jgi:ribosomal-protein-alanine N-acetyltransferase